MLNSQVIATPDPDWHWGCVYLKTGGGGGRSLSSCPLVSDSYCSWAAHKSAGHGMLAKRGIWVKGWRALSFGPPHARWHLEVSQAVKSSPSLSLSLCPQPPRTQLRVVTPCLPRAHPFFPDNPTYFLFSPLDPQDFTPPNHPPSALLSADSTPFLAVRDSSM